VAVAARVYELGAGCLDLTPEIERRTSAALGLHQIDPVTIAAEQFEPPVWQLSATALLPGESSASALSLVVVAE
jgi:hypothetical protein